MSSQVLVTSHGDPAAPSKLSKRLVKALLLSYGKAIGVSVKLGTITVTPLEAEGYLFSRSPRVSLSVSLVPYDLQTFIPSSVGPSFSWTDVSAMLKHTDATEEDIFALIRVFDESAHGCKTCTGTLSANWVTYLSTHLTDQRPATVAMAGVPLEEAVSCPGVTKVSWIFMDAVGKNAGQVRCGRIRVGVSFHPKVIQGPTIHNLLKGLLTDTQQSPVVCDVKWLGNNSVAVCSSRSKPKKVKLQALPHEPGKQKVLGQLKIALRSVHLCTDQCSSVHCHRVTQSQESGLIVRVTCADFVHELHLDASDCSDAKFEQEWPIHSLHSHVEMEFLRRSTACGSAEKLIDGTSAVQICAASVSCLGIQVSQASQFTVNPPRPKLGPEGAPPAKKFHWTSLHHEDEERGLAEVLVEYKEDYGAIFDGAESPDVSFILVEEREFDSAIVQRNIERLESFISVVKSAQLWIAETLDWKYPLRTVAAWSVSTFLCLRIPPEDLPFCLVSAFVAFMVITFIQFRNGNVHKSWIEERPGRRRRGAFRPAATLHFAPVSATGLRSVDGSQTPPGLFLRVFYEPNYKDIPVQLIAQTEFARKRKSLTGSLGLPESKSIDATKTPLPGTTQNGTRLEQDTASGEVDEACSRADSRANTRAFRYRMLQAARINSRTGAEELIPWHQSPGAIRFDVMQENRPKPPTLAGRARVSIKMLVSDEKTGGPQLEQELELSLATPNWVFSKRNNATIGASQTEAASEETASPTVVARMQLMIHDPKTSVTLTEELESEALYDKLEKECEKELSVIAKYRKAKDVAKGIQQTLGQICSTMERAKNLLLWVNPVKTLSVLVIACVACLLLWVIPFKYLVVFYMANEVRLANVSRALLVY